MDFSRPEKRQPGEQILPMINVVFLLLIFFLLSSQIAPRAPFPVVPPRVDSTGKAEPGATLFMAADGRLHFEGPTGAEAMTALAAKAGSIGTLTLRADAEASGHAVAALITKLRTAGVARVVLTGTGH